MLTTVLDLLGLACAVAAILVGGSVAFGAPGLLVALVVVGIVALGSSWLIDRLRRP